MTATFCPVLPVEFEVLNATGEEGARWTGLVEQLPLALRDIHFLPEYGRIYEETYGHRPQLAVYSEGEHAVLFPFVRRRLNELPFLQGAQEPTAVFDISNPYGYGGPVCSCPDAEQAAELFRRFDQRFTAFCRQHRFASEFTSLHPLLDNRSLLGGSPEIELRRQKEVVVIDLAVTSEELWRGLNRGHRSSVNKALRSGIQVARVDMDDARLAEFNRLYYHTMRRNQASDRWFFPEGYFRNCRDCLGSERVSLFVATLEGEVAGMYFLMHDFSTIYYHFGASDERFFDLRPNNLLMFQIACWGRERGFRWYHLGGGVGCTGEDPLFRYKAGFSPHRATLYTYGRVHHRATYDHLCQLKRAHESAAFGSETESDYFPCYRR